MAHIKHLQHLPPKRTVSIKEHWPMHFRTSYESAKLPTAQQKVFKVKKTVFTVHTRNQLGVFDFCQDLNSHQWVGNAWKEPKITRKLTQITQIADPYHICWWLYHQYHDIEAHFQLWCITIAIACTLACSLVLQFSFPTFLFLLPTCTLENTITTNNATIPGPEISNSLHALASLRSKWSIVNCQIPNVKCKLPNQ